MLFYYESVSLFFKFNNLLFSVFYLYDKQFITYGKIEHRKFKILCFVLALQTPRMTSAETNPTNAPGKI